MDNPEKLATYGTQRRRKNSLTGFINIFDLMNYIFPEIRYMSVYRLEWMDRMW